MHVSLNLQCFFFQRTKANKQIAKQESLPLFRIPPNKKTTRLREKTGVGHSMEPIFGGEMKLDASIFINFEEFPPKIVHWI